VRCIEHWLRHLQWKSENPTSTKNTAKEIENEMRGDSKRLVYGSKKASRDRTSSMIDVLLQEKDLQWLCSRSPSFNHFHGQVAKIVAPNLCCPTKKKGEAEAAPFFSLEFTTTLNYEPKYKLFRTAHFFSSHQFVQTQSTFHSNPGDKS
jgi:hypothetical protein